MGTTSTPVPAPRPAPGADVAHGAIARHYAAAGLDPTRARLIPVGPAPAGTAPLDPLRRPYKGGPR